MDKVIVHIGNKTYNCQLAKTEEEHRKGLMDVEYLAPDEKPLSGTYIKSPPARIIIPYFIWK